MTQETNYLGNGKQIGAKIQVSLKWADLLKLTKNEFKGSKYITIDVLPLKEKNQYGKTHTVVEHVPYKKEEK